MTEIKSKCAESLQNFNDNYFTMNLSKDRFDSGYESWAEDIENVTKYKKLFASGKGNIEITKYTGDLSNEQLRQICYKLLISKSSAVSFSDCKLLSDTSAVNRVLLKKSETKIKTLTYHYKNSMEEYFFKVDKIQKSKLATLKNIDKTEKQLRVLSRVTAHINLLSWTTDLLMMGLPVFFRFWGNSRNFIVLSTVTGSLSICGSLFALSHAKHTTDDILRQIRQEKYNLLELESIYRKGNWIDEAIRNLFPHGISQDLIDQSITESDRNFESELSWKQSVCSVIILSNIQKNMKLLTDVDFLMTVKIFVESSAAQIWWKRMEIRKLMNGILSKTKMDVDEGLESTSEIFQNRAALSLLPIAIPLMAVPGNVKMRMILGCFGAMMAAFDLSESEDVKFEELKRIVQKLQDEYNDIKNIWITINTEFD